MCWLLICASNAHLSDGASRDQTDDRPADRPTGCSCWTLHVCELCGSSMAATWKGAQSCRSTLIHPHPGHRPTGRFGRLFSATLHSSPVTRVWSDSAQCILSQELPVPESAAALWRGGPDGEPSVCSPGFFYRVESPALWPLTLGSHAARCSASMVHSLGGSWMRRNGSEPSPPYPIF